MITATMTRTLGQIEAVARSATGPRSFTFVCSTGGRKRDGLALRPDGWRLDAFHRNGGPVLWEHDHQRPPIGRAKAYRRGDKLKADVTFDEADPFARLVESKVKNGFVRQVSVGWDFVDPGSGMPLDHRRYGPDYLERSAAYELNEISVVTVGADPDATLELSRAARSRTIIDMGAYRPPSPPRRYPHRVMRKARELGAPILAEIDRYRIDSRLVDYERAHANRLAEAERDIDRRVDAAARRALGLTVDQRAADRLMEALGGPRVIWRRTRPRVRRCSPGTVRLYDAAAELDCVIDDVICRSPGRE